MSCCEAASFHIEFGTINRTERIIKAEFFHMFRTFPYPQRCEDLSGKGFMNFVKVKILQL